MNAQKESRLTSMFDQTVQTFSEAMKTGVKFQEDMAKWWSDALEQGGPVQESQKRFRALVSEAIPAAQKNAEEWLKIVEQNYRRAMDLLKKAFDSDGSGTAKDLQARTRELWEASMEAVRDSAQAMAEANVKVMEFWADILRKNMNASQAATKVAVR